MIPWTRNRFIPYLLALIALTGCDAIHRIPSGDQSVQIVEVAIFEGGYGIQWHTKMAEAFNREHEADGVRIELWGDPRTADIIKPRLLRGDPPDLILDERLPIWLLIGAHKLFSFNELLDGPVYGGEGSWRENFSNGLLGNFTVEGHTYAIPSSAGAWVCWYDAKLFRERGWTPPKTWNEFETLCEAVQSTGISPLALQGKYVSFYGWNTFVSLVQRVGGLAAINRINNLEPGAFSHPDVLEAARLMQDMAVNYLQKGAMAMTHTESQLQFVNHKAAMIFCGIWLENEMKETIPPGFEMRSFTVPYIQGATGSSRLYNGQGMEYLFVPTDARHPRWAFEFARYLVSPQNAPDMGASIGVISPIRNGTPRDSVSPALQSVLDVMNNADGIFNVRVRDLVPEWTAQTMNAAMAALLRGEATPKEFGRTLDKGLANALKKPDLVIPPYRPYDPARYGEPS